MAAAEIWKYIAPVEFFDTEYLAKYLLSIWSSDTVHAIEAHCEVRTLEQGLDLVEVEKLFH